MAAIKPMYWLTGNYYDCRKKWDEICSLVGDANVEIIECDYSSQASKTITNRTAQASDIILALKNRDMFDARPRILKVKGIPVDYQLMTDYLKLAGPKNLLVIDGPIGYRKPPAKKLYTAKTSKFFKAFKKLGEVCEFVTDTRNAMDAAKWVSNVAQEHGRAITMDAAKRLVEFKGRNCDALYAELLKLFDFQGSKKVTIEAVDECIVPLFQRQVWDLLDSLYARDIRASLAHLQDFYVTAGLETGTSFRGDVERLIAALLKSFRFIQVIKDVSGEYLDYSKITAACRGFNKKTGRKVEGKGEYAGRMVDEYDGEYFETNFIRVNLNKPSTKLVVKWPLPMVYGSTMAIQSTQLALRCHRNVSEYNRGGIKELIDSLAILICGKINIHQFMSKVEGNLE